MRLSLLLLYIFGFAVYGVMVPFLPLILRDKGLSDADISFTLGSFGLAAMTSPVVFGFLADRHFSYNRLVALIFFGAGVASVFLNVIDSPISAFIVILAFYLFFLPYLSLSDQYTLAILEQFPNDRLQYRHYRAIGSAGFILPAIMFAVFGWSNQVQAETIVHVTTALCFTSFLIALFLPRATINPSPGKLPTREALDHAKRAPMCDLFIATFLTGMSLACFFTFFPRYLQELGVSLPMIGAIINFGVLFEVILIPHLSTIIDYCGLRRLIAIAIALVALRLLMLIADQSILTILLSQLLHAPIVIGLFVAIPIYIREQADASYRFSLQSLHAMLTFGLARVLGPWLVALYLGFRQAPLFDGILEVFTIAAILSVLAYALILRTFIGRSMK